MPDSRKPTISMACPHCGRKLRVPAALAGKRGKCPGCKKVVVIKAPGQVKAMREMAAPPRRQNRKALILGTGVLAVALLGLIIFLMQGETPEDPEKTTKSKVSQKGPEQGTSPEAQPDVPSPGETKPPEEKPKPPSPAELLLKELESGNADRQRDALDKALTFEKPNEALVKAVAVFDEDPLALPALKVLDAWADSTNASGDPVRTLAADELIRMVVAWLEEDSGDLKLKRIGILYLTRRKQSRADEILELAIPSPGLMDIAAFALARRQNEKAVLDGLNSGKTLLRGAMASASRSLKNPSPAFMDRLGKLARNDEVAYVRFLAKASLAALQERDSKSDEQAFKTPLSLGKTTTADLLKLIENAGKEEVSIDAGEWHQRYLHHPALAQAEANPLWALHQKTKKDKTRKLCAAALCAMGPLARHLEGDVRKAVKLRQQAPRGKRPAPVGAILVSMLRDDPSALLDWLQEKESLTSGGMNLALQLLSLNDSAAFKEKARWIDTLLGCIEKSRGYDQRWLFKAVQRWAPYLGQGEAPPVERLAFLADQLSKLPSQNGVGMNAVLHVFAYWPGEAKLKAMTGNLSARRQTALKDCLAGKRQGPGKGLQLPLHLSAPLMRDIGLPTPQYDSAFYVRLKELSDEAFLERFPKERTSPFMVNELRRRVLENDKLLVAVANRIVAATTYERARYLCVFESPDFRMFPLTRPFFASLLETERQDQLRSNFKHAQPLPEKLACDLLLQILLVWEDYPYRLPPP